VVKVLRRFSSKIRGGGVNQLWGLRSALTGDAVAKEEKRELSNVLENVKMKLLGKIEKRYSNLIRNRLEPSRRLGEKTKLKRGVTQLEKGGRRRRGEKQECGKGKFLRWIRNRGREMNCLQKQKK